MRTRMRTCVCVAVRAPPCRCFRCPIAGRGFAAARAQHINGTLKLLVAVFQANDVFDDLLCVSAVARLVSVGCVLLPKCQHARLAGRFA